MERIDKECKGPSNGKRLTIGVLFLFFGAMLLSKHMMWFPNEIFHYIFHWESILIIIGVIGLLYGRHVTFNLILIIIGLFFMLSHIYDFPIEFRKLLLPALLIFIGIMLIFRRHDFHHKFNRIRYKQDSSEYIDETAVFGGGKLNFLSDNFKGGRLTSIFGGSEINLTSCKLAEGKNVIDVFMVFGGNVLIVPPDWSIKIEVVSIFGGFSDKRHNFTNESKKENKELYIKGMAIFGGGEIKNY